MYDNSDTNNDGIEVKYFFMKYIFFNHYSPKSV